MFSPKPPQVVPAVQPPVLAPLTPAGELLQNLASARGSAQPGDPGWWPSSLFNSGVSVISPEGLQTLVNPKFCLTLSAADVLQRALSTRGIVCSLGSGAPRPAPDGWAYTAPVPWILVTPGPGLSPVGFNAGLLYDYFAHGYPPTAFYCSYCLNLAQWEVLETLFLSGLSSVPPDPQTIMSNKQP